MQQLEVRRLTAAESEKEQQYCYDVIPARARIKWVCEFLGKTDRTIARYRKLLFENCLEYQTLTCANGIDNNILLQRQIELLKEFSDIVEIYQHVGLAIAHYGTLHPHPCDD